MAAEISDITESNQVWPDQIFGYLQAMNAKLDQIDARLGDLDADLSRLLQAWSSGGMKGLRTFARNFATRPDPDGTRAAFLAAGLARLEDHDGG